LVTAPVSTGASFLDVRLPGYPAVRLPCYDALNVFVMYDEKIIFDTPLRHSDGNEWCHLVSYDIEYLYEFAVIIGLKPMWVQKSNKGHIHFDIKSDRIRAMAKKLGAVQVERKYLRRYLDHHFPSMIHL
jgi:hypothetical protein